jgi:solute carrier family 9 (sodium/hydrogen exchanger), member 8
VCLIVRACTVFPLCYVAGLWRVHAIPVQYMIVIWLSGLRGAIAFALSLNVRTLESDPSHAAIIRSSTLFTVLCSTIVRSSCGGSLDPLANRLDLCVP